MVCLLIKRNSIANSSFQFFVPKTFMELRVVLLTGVLLHIFSSQLTLEQPPQDKLVVKKALETECQCQCFGLLRVAGNVMALATPFFWGSSQTSCIQTSSIPLQLKGRGPSVLWNQSIWVLQPPGSLGLLSVPGNRTTLLLGGFRTARSLQIQRKLCQLWCRQEAVWDSSCWPKNYPMFSKWNNCLTPEMFTAWQKHLFAQRSQVERPQVAWFSGWQPCRSRGFGTR